MVFSDSALTSHTEIVELHSSTSSKKNHIVCGRFKSKRRYFDELGLVRVFIRPNASHMSSGGSQNLLFTTPKGSKISPPLFVKFRHHKVVLSDCY